MSDKMSCFESVNNVKGIGDKKASRLSVLGIRTIGDLLEHYPYKYKDRRTAIRSRAAKENIPCLVEGVLIRVSSRPTRSGKSMLECTFRDEDGLYNAVFFNMPYLRQSLKIGMTYSIFGVMKKRNGTLLWTNPEISEKGSEKDRRGIIPVYRCTAGVTNNDLIKWISMLVQNNVFFDWISDELLSTNRICDKKFALRNIHFPENDEHYRNARYRIIYEQLLIYQIAIRLNRREIESDLCDSSVPDVDLAPFTDSLKFKLTEGQLKCIREIESDLVKSKPMNRLVQGDVGCGKTVIAEAAIYKCVKAGYQTAMMAPTEILAKQHYERLSKDFEALGISCCLLVSGMKAAERRNMLEEISSGRIDVIVGTHAIIQNDVMYRNLGLVVTDEQHRFGVNQRKALVNKGRAVNVCVMSATPIPRTLAATVFGDMDFSIVRDKPANRKRIITKKVNSDSRDRAYASVRNELEMGHQAYIIAPSIDSEDDDITSVEQLYKELAQKLNGYKVGLIHGQLDKETKESVMKDFATGKIDVLVATVVIEVGIDVGNATIIVLENSERYGLAQMHQLRGRVGRSEYQSYCYLVCYSNSDTANARADAMVKLSDGFEISEEDYRLRGPGDIMGTMQSGNYQSHIISLCNYSDILEMAIRDSERIISEPRLADLDYVSKYINNINTEDNSNII